MEILASQTPLQPLYQIGTNDTFVISPFLTFSFQVDESMSAATERPGALLRAALRRACAAMK